MSDEFGGQQYRQNRADRAPAAQSVETPPGRLRRIAGPRVDAVLGFMRRYLVLIVFALLILFPVGGLILGYMARPKAGSAEQADGGLIANSADNSAKNKPPPGMPMLSKSQSPPPVVVHPLPPATLDQQTPPSVQVPARPLTPAPALPNPAPNPPSGAAPAAPGTPAYTPMVYSARHDKFFGEGCSGQLTLDATGLNFRCPDDPGSSLQVALADIESVDGNGVRLTSGRKYHFSIAGMGKSNAEQLFANWLSRVR